MKVSIIIPTYNRANKVLQTIQILQLQEYSNFDVIVVVDGSQDKTVELLTAFKSSKPIQIIAQENKGRACSRNAGAAATDADLMIFYDDDTLPDRYSVGQHVAFHENNPNAALLAGNPAEYSEVSKTDFQNYKAFLCERWLAPYYKGYNRLNFDNLFLSGANFSIKRSAFNALGGFTESLKDNEDFDLGYRALQNDLEVWFDYNNIAIHDDPITCKGYVHRLREYARSRVEASSPYQASKTQQTNSGNRAMLKTTIYWLFSHKVWVNIIDGYNLFRLLPKSLRYKLYDVITFSHSQIIDGWKKQV